MKAAKTDFWKYISLSVLGMLGSSGTILADTFFVSNRLGATGLAALNLAISIFGLINGLGMMLGVGGAAHYVVFRSQGHEKQADESFACALFTALGMGGCFLAVGLLFPQKIAQALGADPEILPMCTAYLKTILCFAPFFILNHLLMTFIRNDGSPRLSMGIMVAGSVSNIVLDYTFLYPLNMGIFGAALATGLSPVVGLLTAAPYFLAGKNGFHLVPVKVRAGKILQLVGPGLSALVNECSSSVVLVVFNLLILKAAGNTGVAAYGIVANLALVVLAVFTGISQGVQPLISRAYGKGDGREAEGVYQRGRRLALAVGLGVLLAACVGAPAVVSWFNSGGDKVLQSLAEEGMRIYFMGFLFVGYNYLTTSFFSITQRVRPALLLSLFRGCIGITGAACLFAGFFGMAGIWAAFPAVEGVTMMLGAGCQRKKEPLRREKGAEVLFATSHGYRTAEEETV